MEKMYLKPLSERIATIDNRPATVLQRRGATLAREGFLPGAEKVGPQGEKAPLQIPQASALLLATIFGLDRLGFDGAALRPLKADLVNPSLFPARGGMQGWRGVLSTLQEWKRGERQRPEWMLQINVKHSGKKTVRLIELPTPANAEAYAQEVAEENSAAEILAADPVVSQVTLRVTEAVLPLVFEG